MDEQIGYYLFPSMFGRDDAEQENALRELEGKPRRTFQINRVQYRELGYGLYLPGEATDLFADNRTVNREALDRLMAWTMTQPEPVQELVFNYLDTPTESNLKLILNVLQLEHIVYGKRPSETTLTALILRSLPCTIDKLYELARREHVARRPEANVRQILRRFTRSGKVIEQGGMYHVGR